jgi:hypothetical protein
LILLFPSSISHLHPLNFIHPPLTHNLLLQLFHINPESSSLTL